MTQMRHETTIGIANRSGPGPWKIIPTVPQPAEICELQQRVFRGGNLPAGENNRQADA
jgi:hypothetical protein